MYIEFNINEHWDLHGELFWKIENVLKMNYLINNNGILYIHFDIFSSEKHSDNVGLIKTLDIIRACDKFFRQQ